LSFDSEPLAYPLELLGHPELEVALAVDQPRAFLAVRLCDVAPGGASSLVSRMVLNLCHREGHETPTRLEPGRRYRIKVCLKATGYVVPAGHRVRLALSTSYWPWIWPSPAKAALTVFTGEGSALSLPVRSTEPEDDVLPAFVPAETAPRLEFEWIRPPAPELAIRRDGTTGRTELRMARSFWGARRLPDGLEYDDYDPVAFSLVDDDPLSARVEAHRRIEIRRNQWRTRVEVRCEMTSDAEVFRVSTALDAYEGDVRIYTKTHTCAVPRDHN
jgi:uncharacterized protein